MKFISSTKRLFLALFVLPFTLILAACNNVPAGYVGVKVDKFGDDKGVNIEVREPGRYLWYWNTEQFLFPTFTQNKVWDEDGVNEQFTFQDKDGAELSADIGVTYLIPPDKAAEVFQRYRRGVDEITSIYLRAIIRDELVRYSSGYSASDLYGEGKSKFADAINKAVRERAGATGITVESVYFVGSVRLPAEIKKTINSKISATQIALQKENELQSTVAEAQKLREQARGEADAINTRGKALRENPEYLRQLFIEKWDGQLPRTLAGDANIDLLIDTASNVGK